MPTMSGFTQKHESKTHCFPGFPEVLKQNTMRLC